MASRSTRRFVLIVVAFVAVLVVTLLTAIGMGWIGYFGPIMVPR